jgi:prepilin peptidase CpaA
MLLPQALAIVVLLALSLVSDTRTYKIKNIITIPFALLGLVANCVLLGPAGIKLSVLGWLVPVGALFILFALRMLGAGDIKLFGAIGAMMGCKFALYSIVYSFLFGGLIGIVLLVSRRNTRERLRYLCTYLKSCFLSFKLLEYSDFGDKAAKDRFRFSYAAVPGTLVQLVIVFLNTKFKLIP